MAASKKASRKAVSMVDEDRAFFEHAYKKDPKARAAMDAEGRTPVTKKATSATKAQTRKTSKK